MHCRAWNREQLTLAWVVSAALHATVAIVFVGSAQVSGRVRVPDKAIDTRVPAPADLAEPMAFTIAEPAKNGPQRPNRVVQHDSPRPSLAPRPATAPAPVPESIGALAPGSDATSPGGKRDRLLNGEAAGRQTAGLNGRSLHPPLNAGRSVVYVLDHSASMGRDRKLQQAVDCVRLSLRELPADARFQVVVYHSSPELLLPADELLAASPANLAAAERALRGLPAEGASNHLAGIRKALGLHPDAIFLLTDADDLRAEQIRAVTALNVKRTAIHPVLFGTYRGGDSPFQALARQNRGFTQTVAARTGP